ncbi:GIY-YIG nuclease family protein [Escherichia coli]|uniref:GIY-YIG nuclease family protein n=1 Tax=Escherichia coli TaxID=562 RepID=UPI0013B3DCFF|nr:GIY-YIG nuclease family protein [Escherichia coli]
MENCNTHYLYKITNLLDGKLYIGVSDQPNRRFKAHCKADSLVGRSIKKHGTSNFRMDVLVAGDRAYIYELEAKAIESYNTIAPNGYNLTAGGFGGCSGYKHTDETRKLLADMRLGKKCGPQSAEDRAKKSAALTGRTLSETHKQKIGLIRKGVPKTAEEKAKNSAANKGRKIPPEEIAKRKATIEARKASGTYISPNKGRKVPPEVVAKRLATLAAKKASSDPQLLN